MSYLAYHPKTRPTGRLLANALGFRRRGTLIRQGRPIPIPGFLLRWGNARSPEFDRGEGVVNNAQAIIRAGDKLLAIECLGGSNVPVPQAWRTCPGTGIVLARRRRGFGGTDIQVCGHNPCLGAEWYSGFIPNDREYRIHVVKDEVVRVQRKYLEHPGQRHSEYVKNHANGYVFKAPARKLNQSRLNAAVSAVEALGLDFGAVDLVVDPHGSEHVLEVNTAPACSPLTLSAYVDGFKRHFPQIAGISA